MGGYGALKLFIDHQDYFNTASSTSGALEVEYETYKKISEIFWQSQRLINDSKMVFGESILWTNNNISTLLKKTPIKKTFLIDCGTEDPLLSFSTNLKTVTEALQIPITFISQPGNHNTAYWQQSIEQHFVYFKQHLKL